ncbi:MAG TPA: TIGR03013 family XrtA/PEP-CTERM system glycosyltransferase [Rhodanobacteraceae bacterium]|nr:TIGR03013 family XrtA/PEP-CTERM system glycosyltransferase [Rhodanobacteraceae bacterium]
MRQHSRRWRVVLVLGEMLLLLGSVFAAVQVRYAGSPYPFSEYAELNTILMRGLIFALFLLLGMTALGLYQAQLRVSAFGVIARQGLGFLLGWIGLAMLYYLLPVVQIGRGLLALSMAIGFVTVCAYHLGVRRLIDADALKRRVLVLGGGWRAAEVIERMRRRSDRRGFVTVGFVAQPGETGKVPAARLLTLSEPLSQWSEREQVDEVVVGVNDRRGTLPMAELLACRERGIAVTELSTFFERESGCVPLSVTNPSWLVFGSGFDASSWRQASKRGFDVGMAVALAVVLWPVMLLTALAIAVESRGAGPLLYRQQRVGERGRCFELIKFRSMSVDAESDGVARWAQKNDARVTRVGRFIRKTRLDELPQLWNVLRGEMSFIGPRPERPQFVNELAPAIPYYYLRHAVKPGLTGWAQLRYPYGASVNDAAEKLRYDLFYVKNHNLLFDLMILIQTVEVVLFGHGAR